jgi:hypothetical protein
MKEKDSLRFYGYKHWTLEESPRCFYVGKGLVKRPFSDRRSPKWHAVVKRFGLRVEVCVGPISNEEAIQWEINTIKNVETFTNDFKHNGENINCNFTTGGEGGSGHIVCDDARAKISFAQKGKPKTAASRKKISDALTGRVISDDVRQKMSVAHKGKPLSALNKANLWKNRSRTFSDAHLEKLSEAAKKRIASDETRQKMSDALKGKPHKCSVCGKLGHSKITCARRAND